MPGFTPWSDPKLLVARNLSSHADSIGGSFTASQNRATLIVGLVCACVSLAITFTTLRWFILMRRLFRHRLILFLVVSDACKAIWYFAFGIVAIAGGPVQSQSGFCQASGFMLLMAMAMSDIAILILALHTILCIFKPSPKSGEGGLYPWRHWIYPFWLGPPIIVASLAFINDGNAYVTAGTLCFLPKRPFWYRLALSWIPRYVIITLILAMYAAVYVYVHIKFRGFRNLQASDSSRDSALISRRTADATILEPGSSQRTSVTAPVTPLASVPLTKPRLSRPGILRSLSSNTVIENGETRPPWESMSFITQTHFTATAASQATPLGGSVSASPPPHEGTHSPASGSQSPPVDRRQSEAPTNFTSDTVVTHTVFESGLKNSEDGTVDHLRNTRAAIRKQLRFLFIYPLIYVLMWTFPFANHISMYFTYIVQHPIFWLSIMSTLSLALQAGVNGLVFSIKEQPWRRIDPQSRFSINFCFWIHKATPDHAPEDETEVEKPPAPDNSHWWEAEGRRRRDSVWMGTDVLTPFASRKHQRTNTLGSISERSPV